MHNDLIQNLVQHRDTLPSELTRFTNYNRDMTLDDLSLLPENQRALAFDEYLQECFSEFNVKQ